MKNWSGELNKQIDINLQKAREKDLRFFRIDEFKRNIGRTDEFSTRCRFCLQQKGAISAAVESLEEAVEVPGKKRREYDKLISRLSKHMQKEHGFYPPYYFSYLFAFFGLAAGFCISYLMALLFPVHAETMYLLGFTVGIVGAYFWGSQKDKKVRKSEKIM